jgi:hypothetical protein
MGRLGARTILDKMRYTVRLLFSGETWVIDTTGCQYGFREVLVPFEKYMADKACRIFSEPITYDAVETKDLDYFSTLPFLNMTSAQRKDRDFERKTRLQFAGFVDTHVDKALLGGSDDDFKDALDSFVQTLGRHFSNFCNK